jgi:hypothetical protein
MLLLGCKPSRSPLWAPLTLSCAWQWNRACRRDIYRFMLSANGWLKLILNAAFACLIVFVAIKVAIRAIAKRFMPSHTRIGLMDARLKSLSAVFCESARERHTFLMVPLGTTYRSG